MNYTINLKKKHRNFKVWPKENFYQQLYVGNDVELGEANEY